VRSSVSWKPAVPPPPVFAAPDGIVVLAGATVTVSVTVVWGATAAVAVAVAVDVDVDVELVELRPGVPPGSAEPPDAVEPPEEPAAPDAVPEVTVGEKTVGVDVVVPEVHAETATGTRRVRAPQQRAVSLALSGVPTSVPRTFMDPSSWAGQMTVVFPFPAAETGIPERKNA
jgi:hypothetical protein